MRISEEWLQSQATSRVMAALTARGAQAYFVGGCVRNAIIHTAVSDIDIATDALPEQVMTLAKEAGLRAVPTGIQHGTVTLVSEGKSYEVTTFRKDVTTDGRRATVEFSTRIEQDAKRRDFTMNALYSDASGQVIDPLGGLGDLLDRRVRFIDDAALRIAEDYLRILRFFRFHAWYGDAERGPDAVALAACAAGIAGLGQLSKERIGSEMRKLLSAPDPVQSVVAMDRTGVLAQVLSGAQTRGLGDVVGLETSLGLATEWRRRLVWLMPQQAGKDLRLSNKDALYINKIAQYYQTDQSLDKVAYYTGANVAMDVAVLRAARRGDDALAFNAASDIEKGATAEFPVRAIDLMELYSGKELGSALKGLESKWIVSGFKLTRESLLDGL